MKKKKLEKLLLTLVLLFVFFIYDEWKEKNSLDDTTEMVVDVEDTVQLKVDGNLNVYYFDVGQADSILIENDGYYMLIDAGNNADGNNLANYFNDMGIKEFKHVIATHAHEDHIGGMDNILNNFKVDNFYMPDVVTTSKTFEDVITALEDNNVSLNVPSIGDTFMLGDCKFEVLHLSDDDSDLNDTSIVVRGVYDETAFLFMGDATSEVEEKILNSNIKSEVLKVGHHGSMYSSSLPFLNKVTPKYAIISAGEGNSYGHPHNVALKRINNIGAVVYRTDEDGTIVATSDGKNISIRTIETSLDG